MGVYTLEMGGVVKIKTEYTLICSDLISVIKSLRWLISSRQDLLFKVYSRLVQQDMSIGWTD